MEGSPLLLLWVLIVLFYLLIEINVINIVLGRYLVSTLNRKIILFRFNILSLSLFLFNRLLSMLNLFVLSRLNLFVYLRFVLNRGFIIWFMLILMLIRFIICWEESEVFIIKWIQLPGKSPLWTYMQILIIYIHILLIHFVWYLVNNFVWDLV